MQTNHKNKHTQEHINMSIKYRCRALIQVIIKFNVMLTLGNTIFVDNITAWDITLNIYKVFIFQPRPSRLIALIFMVIYSYMLQLMYTVNFTKIKCTTMNLHCVLSFAFHAQVLLVIADVQSIFWKV